jgi:uncharacterized protein (TIGR00251 family)
VQPTYLEDSANGCLLRLWIQPRASKTEVMGLHGEPPRLKLRVAAPPVDGAANEAVIEFLAKTLGIPKSRIELVRGQSAKQKDLLIHGLGSAQVRLILMKATP